PALTMDWAVILAGGSGLRFWPLSSPAQPKQLLPLAGDKSTAQESLDRLAGVIPAARTLIVAGAALAPVLTHPPAPHPPHPPLATRRAGAGPAQRGGRAASRFHCPGLGLGPLGGRAPRPRRRSAVAACGLGGGRPRRLRAVRGGGAHGGAPPRHAGHRGDRPL